MLEDEELEPSTSPLLSVPGLVEQLAACLIHLRRKVGKQYSKEISVDVQKVIHSCQAVDKFLQNCRNAEM